MKNLSPSTKYILEGLIPYTEANIRLSFMPRSFFYELEKRSHIKERTLRSAYHRAINNGLLEIGDNRVPKLTNKALLKLELYKPTKLDKDTYLLIMFDIPETERAKRNYLRSLLKQLSFTKIQHSVWASKYDHRGYLAMEINEHNLQDYVYVYEAARLEFK